MANSSMTDKLGDTLLGFRGGKRFWQVVGLLVLALLLVEVGLGWYWSSEPEVLIVEQPANAVTGEVTTATLIKVASTLLEKKGGYLSNDMMPHRLWLDNMPNWEFGAVVQVRDMTRILRRDMSRSQSQSLADDDLAIAEPQFNFDNASWAIPSTEGEYRRGIRALERYQQRLRLPDSDAKKARFYARADNLDAWLADVQHRLGDMSQKLSDSVGREQVDLDTAPGVGDDLLSQQVRTPWLKIDDVFYEVRGASWALVALMRAVEVDFADVLKKKNATASYRQMLRELESTQQTLWSPMVLNGSGFGMFANHSLVMANYISRANAAIIELRQLLQNG